MQNDVEKIVHKNDIKCMLIESDCGSGKTEAALYGMQPPFWVIVLDCLEYIWGYRPAFLQRRFKTVWINF